MAFEVVPPTAEQLSCVPDSPPGGGSSNSEIDRLLSEILSDPNVFSLIDSSPASSSSSAPSPPCSSSSSFSYSPSPQQLEQEALASLQQQQQLRRPQTLSRDQQPRCCVAAAETPSPCTPSSSTDDPNSTYFPPSPLSLPSPHPTSHPYPHPSSLPIYPALPPPHPSHPHHHPPHPGLPAYLHPSLHPSPSSHVLENVEVCVACNFGDPLLRGTPGKIISVDGSNLSVARVYVYSVNQECRIPVNSLEFVNPKPGDLVRVIQGSLSGVNALLLNSIGQYSNIQLLTGTWTQVDRLSLAKLVVDTATGTPVATPTSPHPLPSPTSPSLASPTLLSPASMQFPSFPVQGSSYPPTPSPPTPLHSFPPPSYNHQTPTAASSSYLQTSYARPIRRRSVCLPGQNGTVVTPLARQFNLTNMPELQRQRFLRQHREVAQRRLQLLRGNSLNLQNKVSQQSSINKTDNHLKSLERSTQELLEELKNRKTLEEYDFGATGDGGGELSSNCIQVPLICPISQRRITLPCRGDSCKHPQCFDAEAYIEFNKCVIRPKDKKCQSTKTLKQQLFKCPLCSKTLPFSSLYIDKTLLEILKETEVDEVEFDKTGSWKPVQQKSEEDVIDLTLEEEHTDSSSCSPSP